MSFSPHTTDDIAQMLQSIGSSNVDELFDEVAAALPPGNVPDLPGSNEFALRHHLWDIARLNGRPAKTCLLKYLHLFIKLVFT